MMKIHETTMPDGTLSRTFLRKDEGGLAIVIDDVAHELPNGALAAVMRRFGAPVDPEQRVTTIATLDLGDGTLCHVRHLAGWDVIARDWLVYQAAGGEPLAALATTVAGALAHLAAHSV